MSDMEYQLLGLKRFVATLFFKYTTETSNEESIALADQLLKDLN
jgi:hypothetical protein